MSGYREIAASLRRRIGEREFPVGAKLPSISELQAEYGNPALSTVRAAQQQLVEEGLLRTRRGVGAFVTGARPHDPVDVVGTLRAAGAAVQQALAALEGGQAEGAAAGGVVSPGGIAAKGVVAEEIPGSHGVDPHGVDPHGVDPHGVRSQDAEPGVQGPAAAERPGQDATAAAPEAPASGDRSDPDATAAGDRSRPDATAAAVDGPVGRRAQLLSAACRVVARRGVRGLRVEAVAEEAGVSTGLIYHHFRNRSGLVTGAMLHINDRLAGAADVGASGDGRQRLLRRMLSEFGEDEQTRENSAVWGEVRGAAVFDGQLRPVIDDATEHWIGQLAELIAAGKSDGSIPETVSSRPVAVRLTALVEGLSNRWLAGLIDTEEACAHVTAAVRAELAAALES